MAERFDIVVVGGAMMGSSLAWHLSANDDFDGSILVLDRDMSYEFSSTAHTNSCIRQQFSTPLNIRISQFGAEFIKTFRERLGNDEVPDILLESYGYMYLADNEEFADNLRAAHSVQRAHGAATQLMSREEIAADYPFYTLDDIILGSHNKVDEGLFDGGTIFYWLGKQARLNGVEYRQAEVSAIRKQGRKVLGVTLSDGTQIDAGAVVNCSGPRGALTAAMVDVPLPVEPRRRYTFIFDAAEPLDRPLPLTIDPSGVHLRSDGKYYLAGCPPDGPDPAVDFDDFNFDHDIWENKLWPIIATRVPAFERVKVINSWVGHYAFNTLDQNAIIGKPSSLDNFYLMNGFSGHGLQQSPAMGRGMSELITYGEYRSLDMSALGYERIENNQPYIEKAVI